MIPAAPNTVPKISAKLIERPRPSKTASYRAQSYGLGIRTLAS